MILSFNTKHITTTRKSCLANSKRLLPPGAKLWKCFPWKYLRLLAFRCKRASAALQQFVRNRKLCRPDQRLRSQRDQRNMHLSGKDSFDGPIETTDMDLQDAFCSNIVEAFYDNNAGRDEYDIRELSQDPFPYTFYVQYLNSPKVQGAIGAYQNFSEGSNVAFQAFTATGDDNREVGTIEALRNLIEQNVTVMLYAGDADYKFVLLSIR